MDVHNNLSVQWSHFMIGSVIIEISFEISQVRWGEHLTQISMLNKVLLRTISINLSLSKDSRWYHVEKIKAIYRKSY